MTDSFRAPIQLFPSKPTQAAKALQQLDPDSQQLLSLASQLGPLDLVVISNIIRKAAEICDSQGEEVALAVIAQIEGILRNRPADA